jgi:hypothetical protein
MANHLPSTIATAPLVPVELVEHLPPLLLSVLERRYLSAFRPGDWQFEDDGHPALPVVREVTALGRNADPQGGTPMSAVLASLHEQGQALVMVLHGADDSVQGHRHRLYYGARRLPGGSAIDDYLQGQSGSLAAHFPGLELGLAGDFRARTELVDFLRSAPALAAVTGIPSTVGGRPAPGLDRLTKSIGNRDYAILVVAEPLEASVLDAALDACRHLQSDVSAYTGRQVSRSRGGSESEDKSDSAPTRGAIDRLPAYLNQCAMFASAACHNPILAGLVMGGRILADAVRQPEKPQPRRSVTENWSESASVSLVDAVARACIDLLSAHAARLQAGRGWGWWRTAVYLAADGDATLQSVSRSLRAVATGDATGLDPLRLIDAPTDLLRQAMLAGRVLRMRPSGDAPTHPLGESFDALATCVNSAELAVLVAPPLQEIPGLMVRDRGEFSVTVPIPAEESFELGRVRDAAGDEHGPARLSARALNEHILVIGTPGSGKTNTCMHLMLEAYNTFRVPFLVIEPAKAEYRRLKQALGEELRVYSIGGPGGMPLRLNPLAPVAGAPLSGHIDLLKAVFNASFAMHPGMPQILEQALHEVYEERGWSTHTGENEALGSNPLPGDLAALTPCLSDLHDQIESVMERKGYGGEIRLNLGAAIRSRLLGLTLGAKGYGLNSRRSVSAEELFGRPTVLELQHLRDDEEKAFVIAVLLMLLYQYTEVRQRMLPGDRRERLQHVTLIEEAHRLLAAPRGSQSGESADPRGKAVEMFTNMLAELRALGEGFVIAEQIPSKLTPDALKNTNLKIIHRLTAPSERMAAGQSINLTERQLRHLSNFSKGLAVVHGLSAAHDSPVADAALVQVRQVKDVTVLADDMPAATKLGGSGEEAKRHGGCLVCPDPCAFYHRVEPELRRSRSSDWVFPFAEAAMAGNAPLGWELWTRFRTRSAADGRSAGDDYCRFVHAARDWCRTILSARGKTVDGRRFRPADQLAAERLAGEFGRMARDWLGRTALDSDGESSFAQLHRTAWTVLENSAPPDLPGCSACPARCRLLPWVASLDLAQASTVIGAAIPRNTNDAFRQPTQGDARWDRVAAVLPTIERTTVPPQDADPELWRRHFRYCLLTNVDLPPEVSGYREGILGAILNSKPSPSR